MKERLTSLFCFIWLIVIFLSICLFSSKVWAFSSVQITNTPENERNPSIAIKDIFTYVTWEVHAKDMIYFAISSDNGKNWTRRIKIGTGNNPTIIVNNNSYIYIVWQYDGNILIKRSINNGISFEDSVRLGWGYRPDMAIDDNDYIYVVWQRKAGGTNYTPIYFTKSINNGNTFSEPIIVEDTYSSYFSPPKIAVSPSGKHVYVVWVCPPSYGAYIRTYFSRSTDGGLNFSPRINPTNFEFHGEYDPDIAVSGENIVYIVWRLDQYNYNHLHITRSTDGGESFICKTGGADKINDGSFSSTDAFSPSLALNNSGDIYVIWSDTRNGYGSKDIYYDKSNDGGEHFGIDVCIDSSSTKSDQRNPSIALNNLRILSIVWEDNRHGNYDIYYSHISPTFVKQSFFYNSQYNFRLRQNCPNPFNDETRIEYEISKSTKVKIKIFNILGDEVAILVDEIKEAGLYTTQWNGKNKNGDTLISGIYIYKIQAGDFSQVRKMSLIR